MAFVDEIKIPIKAGRGGDGVVRWRHEKGRAKGGPSGGNGGMGGSVFVHAVRDINALARLSGVSELAAQDGMPGSGRSMDGKKGESLTIDVPIGTVVTNLRTGRTLELLTEGQTELILHGGIGGYGNEHFKSSRTTRPQEATPGKPGEEAEFLLELNLIVDAGLIGVPNAGKSSLLNALTNAKAKVGSFPFTTLDPNLGDLFGYILADIPGLIEGASEGKGLGHKFLKHITRTRVLLHCVSLEEENPLKTYQKVREELTRFDPTLAKKEELVILTKSDAVDEAIVRKSTEIFLKEGIPAITVSILDDGAVKTVREKIVLTLEQSQVA